MDNKLVPITTVAVGKDIQVFRSGIIVTGDLSKENYEEAISTVETINDASFWWMGDLVISLRQKHGKTDLRKLATKNNWDYNSLRSSVSVAQRYAPDQRHVGLSFNHHQFADNPAIQDKRIRETTREEWLKKAATNKWSALELKRQIKSKELPKDAPILPEGVFDVILADCPWQYDFSKSNSRAIESHYPTLTLDDICHYTDRNGVNINKKFAKQAVLFMWATSPKLVEALEVIKAWGFEYKTSAVWVKDKIGMGYWWRERHEILLTATKGGVDDDDKKFKSFSPPIPSLRRDSVIEAPRMEHSVKPDLVYDSIEKMLPREKYLELFARSSRPKWVGWGNEYSPKDGEGKSG